jgi:hypothetical protein
MEHINPSTLTTLRGIFYSRPNLYHLLTGTFWCKLNVCGTCVSVRKKISLTAIEKPITETYLTLRKTYHGKETDIHNE